MNKLSLLGLVALLPFAAHADIIPVSTTITGSGPYTWSYQADITGDQTAFSGPAPSTNPVPHTSTGAFFTIYDFTGYVNGTCVSPTGWSCTAQNVGFTPDDVFPSDGSGVANLTWSYNSGEAIVGATAVSGFSADSIYNLVNQGAFAARATKNVGTQSGTLVDNVGNTNVPISPVPEPATLSIFGLGFLFAAIRRRAIRA